jgi:HupE/UreJ protein
MSAALWLAIAVVLVASPAAAHRPSDAFLTLDVVGVQLRGRWEVALRDLAAVVALDADGDRAITWGELREARAAIAAELDGALTVTGDGRSCSLRAGDVWVDDRIEGRFASIELAGRCRSAPAELSLAYRLLFEVDPTHRGLLVLTSNGATHTAVFAPSSASVSLELGEPSHARQFLDYLREGMHHIWIGADHILFLVSLLLPCVLVRSAGSWRGVARLPSALADVLAVVTAFTVAHSITLLLAALGVLRLPTALTESAIALSVLFAAANNVRPWVVRGRWAMAFGFGLVHGFGFASVLGELGLPAGAQLLALIAFNLGVELGQLAVVGVVVPFLYVLRNAAFYRRVVLVGGSSAVAVIAAEWFAQRSGLL